jgi:hypothetical protein
MPPSHIGGIMKDEKEVVVFLCRKYPKLHMSIVPMGLKDEQGNPIPRKIAMFGLNPKEPGVYKTSNKEVIEKIRKSEMYKSGMIIEVDEVPLSEKEQEKVKVGITSSKK